MITKRVPSSPVFCSSYRNVSPSYSLPRFQCLHTSIPRVAIPLPITATGPPPAPPQPAASQYGERVDRRRRQAELLERAQDMRVSQMKPGTAIKKRFWKDVSVQSDDGMSYHTQWRLCFLPQICREYLAKMFDSIQKTII